jgi:hypothetical protein
MVPSVAQPVSARQPKGWLATLAVLVIMLGILIGGFVAQEAVANEPPKPVSIGGVVLTPPTGWDFAGRSEDESTILLTNGSGSLAISVVPGTDVVQALAAKRAEWLSTGTVTATEPEPVTINYSRAGRRFSYSGTFEDVPTPVEGAVTGIAGNGVVVLFDGWAGIGGYKLVSDEIDNMIAAATIP